MVNRRQFLAGSLLACTAARSAIAQSIPNSAGDQPPRLKAPALACDSHHHIYDARFPVSPHWRGGRPDGIFRAVMLVAVIDVLLLVAAGPVA